MKRFLMTLLLGWVCTSLQAQDYALPKGYILTDMAKVMSPEFPWDVPVFYPVGWSADGNQFAYFEDSNIEGLGQMGTFTILDLSKGKPVVRMGNGRSEEDRFPDAEALWEAMGDSISKVLAAHQITQTMRQDYQGGDIQLYEDEYYRLEATIGVNPVEPDVSMTGQSFDLAKVVMTCNTRPTKVLLDYERDGKASAITFDRETQKFQVLGLLYSPKRGKALMFLEIWTRGYEGGSDCAIRLVPVELGDK